MARLEAYLTRLNRFSAGFCLVFWLSISPEVFAKNCKSDAYTTNYFLLFIDSNEDFITSVICDFSFWLWEDWKATIGTSNTVASSFPPSGLTNFLIGGSTFSGDEYTKNRFNDRPITGFGVSASRYYDYETVVFGYGGSSVDFLNFTLEDKLKLGTWKNTQTGKDIIYGGETTEYKFEIESQVSLQILGMGLNLCPLKLGAVGGLFHLSACYVPSVGMALITEDGVEGGGLNFMRYERITIEANTSLFMDLYMFGGSSLGFGYNFSAYRLPGIPESQCPSCPEDTYLFTNISTLTIVSRTLF